MGLFGSCLACALELDAIPSRGQILNTEIEAPSPTRFEASDAKNSLGEEDAYCPKEQARAG